MNSYIGDFKTIFVDAKTFFKSVKEEKGILKPYAYYIVTGLIIQILFMTYMAYDFMNNPDYSSLDLATIIVILLFWAFIALMSVFVFPFISSLFTHIGLLMVGVKKIEFEEIFKSVSYVQMVNLVYSIILTSLYTLMTFIYIKSSIEPSLSIDVISVALFIVIIIVLIISLAHSLYTVSTGLSVLLDIGAWRAFFGYIIIPVILIVLVLIGILILVGSLAYFGTLTDPTLMVN